MALLNGYQPIRAVPRPDGADAKRTDDANWRKGPERSSPCGCTGRQVVRGSGYFSLIHGEHVRPAKDWVSLDPT